MAKNSALDTHILNIIQTQNVQEQGELQAILKTMGIDAPQATLSRWLKKLNIAKIGGIYRSVGTVPTALPRLLALHEAPPNLLVLHTLPGQANSLAYHIDQAFVANVPFKQPLHGILGTIAGDDTILVIVDMEKIQEAAQALKQALSND